MNDKNNKHLSINIKELFVSICIGIVGTIMFVFVFSPLHSQLLSKDIYSLPILFFVLFTALAFHIVELQRKEWPARRYSDFKELGVETYINDRLNQRLIWYDRKAKRSKFCFLSLKIIIILCSATVPLLTSSNITLQQVSSLFSFAKDVKLETIISSIVVVLVSIESVLHNKEQWRNYRRTKQCLMKEYYDFTAGINFYSEYNDPQNAFLVFVERVENLILTENDETLRAKTSWPRQNDPKIGAAEKKNDIAIM